MGRTAEVGHDKLLNLLDSGSPLLGTSSKRVRIDPIALSRVDEFVIGDFY